MDAVILANYFHEHAPFAIKALEAGKHVMSECAACNTLAEGVELCRAVEQIGQIYMLAENYPYTAFNQEMAPALPGGRDRRSPLRRGRVQPPDVASSRAPGISPGLRHWRNNLPATYYCTHAHGAADGDHRHDAGPRQRLRDAAPRGQPAEAPLAAAGRRRADRRQDGQRRHLQAAPGRRCPATASSTACTASGG